jgi:TRAP-type C4-dicarboxylate transport system substrate-binding protein
MITRRFACSMLGALTLAASSAASAQTFELKVTHFLPPNHTFQKALTAWGEELSKESNGRLKLNIYPASQLGPVNRQFELAVNGTADIAVGLHGATPGRYALTETASGPYVAPSAGLTSAITSKRLTELAPQYLAKEHQGLKILWMAVTPPLMFFSKTPMTKVEDFKGQKIRYAGANFKQIIEKLGGVGVPVPPPETTDAMSKGIIDGATFPYEGAASFDLGIAAKYVVEPGISSATFAVVMNPAKYESLPADLKAIIDRTTGPQRAEWYGAMWDEAEKAGKASILAKGVKVNEMTPAELARMKATVASINDDYIAGLEKRSMPAKAFYDAYTK